MIDIPGIVIKIDPTALIVESQQSMTVISSGTIHTILLIGGSLSSAAMVNAVMTATEAKTAVLHDLGAKTTHGFPATSTTTDSVVVACIGRGVSLPYAGSATPVGYLIGRAVRESLKAQLL